MIFVHGLKSDLITQTPTSILKEVNMLKVILCSGLFLGSTKKLGSCDKLDGKDPLNLRNVFCGISVHYLEAAILVYRNTLASYAVSALHHWVSVHIALLGIRIRIIASRARRGRMTQCMSSLATCFTSS